MISKIYISAVILLFTVFVPCGCSYLWGYSRGVDAMVKIAKVTIDAMSKEIDSLKEAGGEA